MFTSPFGFKTHTRIVKMTYILGLVLVAVAIYVPLAGVGEHPVGAGIAIGALAAFTLWLAWKIQRSWREEPAHEGESIPEALRRDDSATRQLLQVSIALFLVGVAVWLLGAVVPGAILVMVGGAASVTAWLSLGPPGSEPPWY